MPCFVNFSLCGPDQYYKLVWHWFGIAMHASKDVEQTLLMAIPKRAYACFAASFVQKISQIAWDGKASEGWLFLTGCTGRTQRVSTAA